MAILYESLHEVLVLALELLAFGFVFYFVEKIKPAEKNTPFIKKDSKNELLLAFLNAGIINPLAVAVIGYLLLHILTPIIPYQMFDKQINALPFAAQFVFAALFLDTSTYWRHRFTHERMWSYHSVHHSATQLNWLTALRMHPVDGFTALLFNMIFMHLFGFSGPAILFSIWFLKIMNYATHINIDFQFNKPMRYILATPNYHRWHHATVKEAYNKNYCGAFPFLDVLFGTFHHPEQLPEAMGLSPREQEAYPDDFPGWLAYPFKRTWRLLQSKKK